MNQAQQAVSEQSRKLKELKQELQQIKSGAVSGSASLNKTTVNKQLDETQNKSAMFLEQSRINQTQMVNTTQIPGGNKQKRKNKSKKRSQSRDDRTKIIEYISSSDDEAQNDLKLKGKSGPATGSQSLDEKTRFCLQIIDVFSKGIQKEEEQQPMSRSMKMQNQIKVDKIKEFLSQFEKGLYLQESNLQKEVNNIQRNEQASEKRKETATRMIADLEKKLFESERERVILRREKDDLTREIKEVEGSKERQGVNKEMIDMIKENQRRLEDSNRRMQEMIVRQEKEMRDKEEAWNTQVSIMKEVFINTMK